MTHFVKVLKRESATKNVDPQQLGNVDLQTLSQLLTGFLSNKRAADSRLFVEALAALDCILSYQPTTLGQLKFGAIFYNNIRQYFLRICTVYEGCS